MDPPVESGMPPQADIFPPWTSREKQFEETHTCILKWNFYLLCDMFVKRFGCIKLGFCVPHPYPGLVPTTPEKPLVMQILHSLGITPLGAQCYGWCVMDGQ